MPPKSSGIKSYRYLCSRVIWKYKRISVATEEKSVSNPISSQNWTEADCLGKSRAHLPCNRLYRPIPRNPTSLAQAPHQRKCQQTEKGGQQSHWGQKVWCLRFFKVLKCSSFCILNSWEQNPFSVSLFGSNDSFTIGLLDKTALVFCFLQNKGRKMVLRHKN